MVTKNMANTLVIIREDYFIVYFDGCQHPKIIYSKKKVKYTHMFFFYFLYPYV